MAAKTVYAPEQASADFTLRVASLPGQLRTNKTIR